MALLRSLDSGVSGMLNNQLGLDISGNNLANVNTPGFKGSRVSFSNALIQTTFSGSAPGTNIGGQNPRQVGLGVSTSSVDVDFSQGALAATGRNLDLSIQGEGFFEVTDGTGSFYTRVGNFGIDANSNLVHLSSGYRMVGNTYRSDLNPDGSQTVQDQNVDLTIPQGQAFPPAQTSTIDFQGNLDSSTAALQGTSLQSVFPLQNTLTNTAATEETLLSQLNIFAGGEMPSDPDEQVKTMYVFGTKPNGETYAGSFEIEPWATPTTGDANGSLGSLIEKINGVLAQGNERFGTARVENGNLIISAVGAGEGFSFFMGEDGGLTGFPAQPISSTAANATHIAADPPAPDLLTTALDETTFESTGIVNDVGSGLLDPIFRITGIPTPPDPSPGFVISVSKNGREVGTINVPADVALSDPADPEDGFRLPSFPNIAEGDEITYTLTGAPTDIEVTPVTRLVRDNDTNNITQDSNNNGLPDMFEEDSSVDANAWQYRNSTNDTFDWYRARLVPDITSTSIEVYDSQGGNHNVEFRFFRIGTRTQSDSDARINSWDAIINIPPGEGDLIDDLVTGVEFDQFGRFTGSIGTTIHNTSLNSTNFVGGPASQTIQVNWATTGPTDPATVRLDFGESGSADGLTGFGSPSTAAAIEQDGFSDGRLDNISVSAEGDVIALYTNGISRKIAQIPLVTFTNPSGLNSEAGNLWTLTTNSGSPTRREAGQNAGFVTSGALENSNVDIATEFTRLITAQRGFQVSARVVQTSDRILEELANLVR